MFNPSKEKTMSQALEENISRLVEKIDTLSIVIDELKNAKKSEQFLDNDDLTKKLKISKRSLSTWRKQKLLPYSMIGNKIFYAFSDVEKLMNDKKISKK